MDLFDLIGKIRSQGEKLKRLADGFRKQDEAFNKPPVNYAEYAAPALIYLEKVLEWIEATMQNFSNPDQNRARNRWEQKYKVYRIKGQIVTLRFWMIDFIADIDPTNTTVDQQKLRIRKEAFEKKMLEEVSEIADKLLKIGDTDVIIDFIENPE